MRATAIRYGRVKNLGDYNNERVEIEIELEAGEKAEDALKFARIFINRALHQTTVTSAETDQTAFELISGETELQGA